MKNENKEILDKLTEVATTFGKEFALGYAYAIIQQNKLDIIPTFAEVKPQVRPAPNILPKKNIEQSISEPATIVDLDVGKIRTFSNGSKEISKEISKEPPKKTFERKSDEVKANKDLILNCLAINVCGLPIGEVVSYCQTISYAKVGFYLQQLVDEGLVSDTETTIVHGRTVKKYKRTNNPLGNVIITDNRKE